MILVDSSVWIDYFRGQRTPASDRLDELLGVEAIATGDLILAEVLQGLVTDAEFEQGRQLLTALPIVQLLNESIAIQAARNYRTLRARGITVRKTIDTLIATSCIEQGLELLSSDRDFEPFIDHLGLRAALPKTRT